MSQNRIMCTEFDENLEALKHLHEGDHIFSPEYSHIASGDNGQDENDIFEVKEFIFKEYEKRDSKNHTDIELEQDEGATYATIVDSRFPNVPLNHIDLSIGFYMSEESAALSFLNAMEHICERVREYVKSKDYVVVE